ncbi:glucose-6-phosphate dehydrogenase [Sporodiniella umbellata]|nr:glucose-6-phosphate dehydrogenase [Sporodiniella umbellata]
MPKETALKQTRDEVFEKLNEGLTVIVLGASGDLAKKKTYPALFTLFSDGFLPKTTEIIGYARSKLEEKEYHERITSFFEIENDEQKKKKDEFLKICKYVQGQYDEDDSYKKLDKSIVDSEERRKLNYNQRNRLFYMALPPGVYIKVAEGLNKFTRSKEARTFLMVEKPFGKDTQSAIELIDGIKKSFDNEEVFFIDHYLGKELAKNILNIRFSNMIFGPIWNRQYIDTVQITLKEPFGCEGRGGYFDEYGVIRDVIQNHLLQLFSLIAMERPIGRDSESIRDEKVKLLRCTQPVTLDNCLLGQYTKNGDKPGYTEDETVEDGSITATFAAIALNIKNERWDGVPFIIKNGKAMDNSKAEIRIQFKKVPGALFEDSPRNELVFRIQPDDAIYLKFNSKVPGFSAESMITELDLTYKSRYDNLKIPPAYEILLLDAMRGDHSNFVRDDELIAAWEIFTPLLHKIEQEKIKPEPYPYASRGPKKLDEFIKKYGVERNNPEDYQWPKQDLEG